MKKISFISQSGNVAKSTLATAMAIECINNGYESAIADLDTEHRTTSDFMKLREELDIEPRPEIYAVKSANEALTCFKDEDICIIDAPSRATQATKTIALESDLVVQPTTPSTKDIDLALKTFYQLANDGVDPKRMLLVLTRVASEPEQRRAIEYIGQAEINGKPLRILSSALFEKISYRTNIDDGYSIVETSHSSLNDNAKSVIHQILTFLI